MIFCIEQTRAPVSSGGWGGGAELPLNLTAALAKNLTWKSAMAGARLPN